MCHFLIVSYYFSLGLFVQKMKLFNTVCLFSILCVFMLHHDLIGFDFLSQKTVHVQMAFFVI